jgi:hypothetical protein
LQIQITNGAALEAVSYEYFAALRRNLKKTTRLCR